MLAPWELKDSYPPRSGQGHSTAIDTLKELVVENDSGSALFKSALKSVSKLPVDFGGIHVLGNKWNGPMYFDTTLPMSLRFAVFSCQKIKNSVQHMYIDRGFRSVNHLDGFGSVTLWPKAHEVLKELLCSSDSMNSEKRYP